MTVDGSHQSHAITQASVSGAYTGNEAQAKQHDSSPSSFFGGASSDSVEISDAARAAHVGAAASSE